MVMMLPASVPSSSSAVRWPVRRLLLGAAFLAVLTLVLDLLDLDRGDAGLDEAAGHQDVDLGTVTGRIPKISE